MAHGALHTKSHRLTLIFAAAAVAMVVAIAAVSFFALQPAVASHDVDSTTLGIGDARNTATDEQIAAASDRVSSSQASEADGLASDSNSLASSASRSITVTDPDPVVVLAGYDKTNPDTEAAALALGTTDPKPTAPHLLPDEDDGWSTGLASAYSCADNDDGAGNFNTDITASGRALSDNDFTVAVPASQSELLGRAVAIRYGETIIVATVTDTGGFAGYGRALDMAGGCWKAFGASTVHDWGVRTVYYKFL